MRVLLHIAICVIAVSVGCATPARNDGMTDALRHHADAAAQFTGEVVAVHDGDTITVMRDGKGEKVRLNGIDAPELKQPFGRAAKEFASALAYGQQVRVKVHGQDRYGRTVGEVFLPDGRSLNRALVRAGLAWWYRAYSNDQTLGELEEAARTSRAGLWADAAPTPPWEYRRARK